MGRRRLGRVARPGGRALCVGQVAVAVAALTVAGLLVPQVASASPVRLGDGAAEPVAVVPASTKGGPPSSHAEGGPASSMSTASDGRPEASSGRGPSSQSSPKASKHVKAKPSEVFVEPPSAVLGLLSSLGSDERQLLAVRTYGQAQLYVRSALRLKAQAASSVARALGALSVARADEARAVAVELATRSRVQLYRTALYELGIAEYTGQAAIGGTDLASQERQIELAQLSEVAAAAEGAGLASAQHELGLAVRQVALDAVRVLLARRATARAEAALAAARARLARSNTALVVARTWATDPGEAPSQPARALLVLEAAPAHGGPKRFAKPTLVAGDLHRASRASGAASLAPSSPSSSSPAYAGGHRAGAGSPTSLLGGARADVAVPGGSRWSTALAGGPSILGPPLLSAAEVVGWFQSTGAPANATVPISTLVQDYFKAARVTGVRPDIAFAQSVVETGYFSFPVGGQDPASYDNFAGIGACDSCKHGWRFPSAYSGVLTQESLLNEYAEPPPLYGPPGGLVAGLGVAGCCHTWMALSGTWASNPNYGYIILSVYKEMVDWALTHQLEQTGLLPAWATSPRLLRR